MKHSNIAALSEAQTPAPGPEAAALSLARLPDPQTWREVRAACLHLDTLPLPPAFSSDPSLGTPPTPSKPPGPKQQQGGEGPGPLPPRDGAGLPSGPRAAARAPLKLIPHQSIKLSEQNSGALSCSGPPWGWAGT